MSDVLSRLFAAMPGTTLAAPPTGLSGEGGRRGGERRPTPPTTGYGGVTPGGAGAMLGGLSGGGLPPADVRRAGIVSLLAFLTGGRGGAKGLEHLADTLRKAGLKRQVDTWISHGPTVAITPEELARAISPEAADAASRHTGLRKDELLAELARGLPMLVMRLTPQGSLPRRDEDLPPLDTEDLLGVFEAGNEGRG